MQLAVQSLGSQLNNYVVYMLQHLRVTCIEFACAYYIM